MHINTSLDLAPYKAILSLVIDPWWAHHASAGGQYAPMRHRRKGVLPDSARVMCPPRINDEGEVGFIAFGLIT